MTALPPDAPVLIVDDHELVGTSLALGLRAEGVAARHVAPGGPGEPCGCLARVSLPAARVVSAQPG